VLESSPFPSKQTVVQESSPFPLVKEDFNTLSSIKHNVLTLIKPDPELLELPPRNPQFITLKRPVEINLLDKSNREVRPAP
jgi:hypothetical protein